jgi:protein SCO1/2
MKQVLILSAAIVALFATGRTTLAALSKEDFRHIGYDQHIGTQISRSLMFEDASKQKVALGDLLNTKPTLLVLGYYHCPMLCTIINDGLIEAMQELKFNVGRDFNVIEVSIDPTETPELAASKKKEYLTRYGRPGADGGWHLLTGDQAAIAQLCNEAGFRFKYDPETHEYAHPSGFLVLTPEGRISRYFFGVNFDPEELRTAIIAASHGQRGSIIHQLVLLCCRYNPITGKYGNLILTVLRICGVGTVVLLGWWIAWMCRRRPEQPASTEVT